MANLAVLVSGTGSLLEAITNQLPVSLVVADRPCRALTIAEEHGIEALLLKRNDFGGSFDYNGYTRHMMKTLEKRRISFVAMAGFMTIFTPPIFKQYPHRMLNTHPSLLPEFKGHHAVRDALAAKARVTGCTVHYATAGVDSGPIIAQRAVPILEDDTVATLHERIKQEERILYPTVIRDTMV